LALLERQVQEGQDTLPEILACFNEPGYVRWNADHWREKAITEITNDYFNTMAFSLNYGDVLDRVWAYIRQHAEKKELTLRLAQEVCEGIQMCTNGKMARLVNVLQGYDDTLEHAKPRELFQSRFSLLKDRPATEREQAANELFTEFQIPAEERQHWLEPLLEA
jgi:hypothetical protein